MKKILLLLAFAPITKTIRGRLYSLFYKDIASDFKIGFGSIIDAKTIKIASGVAIGNMVRMKYLDELIVGQGSSIGSSTIVCGAEEHNKFSERKLIVGEHTNILCSHYFDVVAPIIIGDYVTIAGKWTQFYTHSFDLERNRCDGAIHIGNHVYIGAGCLINLGVSVCDEVVLQGGTCVNHSIDEPGVYMSNTFLRRGSVREYSQMFAENECKILDGGKRVFLKNRESIRNE